MQRNKKAGKKESVLTYTDRCIVLVADAYVMTVGTSVPTYSLILQKAIA